MWATRQVPEQDRVSLIRDARDYALTHGLVIRNQETLKNKKLINNVSHPPFTVLPSPFPRKLYEECLETQPIVNNLLLKIANAPEFIEHHLEQIVKVDSFTQNLLNINNVILKEGRAQPIVSCISRADYMIDGHQVDSMRMRQVEINAIASSMSAHSVNVARLQNYIRTKYDIKLPEEVEASIPENNSLDLVAQGIIDVFDAYGKEQAFVLLINEEISLNFSDQYLVEIAVHKKRPDIRFVRKIFRELQAPEEGGEIRLGPNKELLIDINKEIALVYFRYGYDPSNYDFLEAWDIRLKLEQSRAIKCPSINFHLAGAKKFQQILNTTEKLEHFLDSKDAQRLANNFCQFWPLNTDSCNLIKQRSGKLVLKPQREGGGHNIFGADIESFIDKIENLEDLAQYILMEYIDSPREHNQILFSSDTLEATSLFGKDLLVSELGIYGSILAQDSMVMSSRSAGYLVRSKKWGVNEGGVSAGYAGISCIILLDSELGIGKHQELFYEA